MLRGYPQMLDQVAVRVGVGRDPVIGIVGPGIRLASFHHVGSVVVGVVAENGPPDLVNSVGQASARAS